MTRSRKTIGILFGGRSAEHDVSKLSAANVMRAINPECYDIVPIGIAKDGRWRLCATSTGAGVGSQVLEIPETSPEVAIVPGGRGHMFVVDNSQVGAASHLHLDVVFPVLHGPNGEDGTVQGSLELANVPYIGSSVLGSAAGMDKDVAKRLLRDSGIPVVPFIAMTTRRRIDYSAAVEALGSSELFVKPANMGSSVGVAPARSAADFNAACDQAFRYDEKVLVERSVTGAREIECSVLEGPTGAVRASPLGEIVPDTRHGFYSYEAKYLDETGTLLRIPADLSPALTGHVQDLAVKTFKALGCEGLARVDFFVAPSGEAYLFVNEVNTLPGFTAMSMYPKLWEYGGLSQEELLETLIAHALARYERRSKLAGF
jgi:D-alanine-D-alanine ligase